MGERTVTVAIFSELYGRYAGDVYRFAVYLSGNAAWAEDITSETFLRLWLSPAPVRSATVKAYLMAIARNLYLRQAQKESKWNRIEDESLPATESTERRTETREELRLVLRDLQRLPESDRAAVLLQANGVPYEEIASILGVTVSAGKVKVHRARLKLAEWRAAREVMR